MPTALESVSVELRGVNASDDYSQLAGNFCRHDLTNDVRKPRGKGAGEIRHHWWNVWLACRFRTDDTVHTPFWN